MNLFEVSLRAVIVGAVAALLIAIARWRDKPLSASFEHALWIFVLASMLCSALPKITVHSNPSTAGLILQSPVPAAILTVTPSNTYGVLMRDDARVPRIAVIWIAGASLMLLRIFLGVFLTRRSLASARTILGEGLIRSAILEHANLIGGVRESKNVVVPMTVGWPYAHIVLPATWRTWPIDKVRAVVNHELAHVRRRDVLVTFLVAINKAIFWFHPLAWWLEHRLADLAEFAADEAAVRRTGDPHAYAERLLEMAMIARPLRLRWNTASVDFARLGITRLNRRVNRILRPETGAGSPILLWTAATVIAAMTFIQFQRPMRAQDGGARFANGLHYSVNIGPFATKLSAGEAEALERQLAANPGDDKARLDLSVYYFDTNQNDRRLQLVYWLIDHHPDSPDLSFMSMTIWPSRDGLPAYAAAVDRWHAKVAAQPDNVYVLLNAAKAIGTSNFNEEIALLKKGQVLDRERFTGMVAQLYSNAISSSANRAVAISNPEKDPVALAALRADLASSNDALLLGKTGSMLVEDASRKMVQRQQSYDTAVVKSTALDLLARAQSLEPSNQSWTDAMEGARRLETSTAHPSATDSEVTVRVEAEVMKANLVYAPELKKPGGEGTIRLRVLIAPSGHVTDIIVVSGPAPLAQLAIEAVKQYVYKPITVNGVAAKVETTVDVIF